MSSPKPDLLESTSKINLQLFPVREEHLLTLRDFVTRRWDHLKVEAPVGITPVQYLGNILKNSDEIYIGGVPQPDGTSVFAGIVWVMYDYIEGTNTRSPIVYLHLIPNTDGFPLRSIASVFYEVVTRVFTDNHVGCVIVSGIAPNKSRRFFERLPYGTFSVLPHSEYHPNHGLVDYWQWSVTRMQFPLSDPLSMGAIMRLGPGIMYRNERGESDGTTSTIIHHDPESVNPAHERPIPVREYRTQRDHVRHRRAGGRAVPHPDGGGPIEFLKRLITGKRSG